MVGWVQTQIGNRAGGRWTVGKPPGGGGGGGGTDLQHHLVLVLLLQGLLPQPVVLLYVCKQGHVWPWPEVRGGEDRPSCSFEQRLCSPHTPACNWR